MKKITVTDVRGILEEDMVGNSSKLYDLLELSDEQLLDADLRSFGFDSLDFEEMYNELYKRYNIKVMYDPLVKYAFYNEATVRNFIEMVNDISQKAVK